MGKGDLLDSYGNGKTTSSSLHHGKILVTIIVFFLLLLIWAQVNQWYEEDLYSDLRAEEEKKLILQSNSLLMSMNKRIVLLDGLHSFMQLHHDPAIIGEHFNSYAKGLYEGSGGIRNFALAPGGIQEYVYPPEEGGIVIGHDLINDSRENVRQDVNLTISSGHTILSGPYELRQGGIGLVARKAVFIDGEFFGLISTVIDVPFIFEEAGIDIEHGELALRTDNTTIFGNPDVFREEPVTQKIYLYNKEWEIARIPEGGWEVAMFESLYLFRTITFLPVFLLTILTYLVLNRKEDLEFSVVQRTKELKIEKEMTQKYLDDSGVMFIMVDVEGRVVLVNRKVKELLGYDEDELIGISWVDKLISGSERDVMKEICQSLLFNSSEEGQYCECPIITKNGDSRLVLWHGSIIKDEDGKITGKLLAGKDITESREAEEALRKYAEELSVKNEQLKSLGKLKDEFISNLSHELRTPMNSVKGFSEVLYSESMGDLNSAQKKALDHILDGSYKLEGLIDSLLYMASSKKDTIKYSFSSIDLKHLLKEVSLNISQDADTKGIEFSVAMDTSLPAIKGNEEHLSKVFWNILNNAIKFTSAGGQVSLSASKLADQVHISVVDNGIGIAEEKLNSVFDEFYQVDGSPTRKYGGTGIGLFISRQIILTHGGDIWIESLKDVGTTVHVTLPVDNIDIPLSEDD